MTETATLSIEDVMAWLRENPNALRQASAQAADDLLNGPAVQAVLDGLITAVQQSQDSAPKVVGQSTVLGATSSAQSLQRIIDCITLGRAEVAARISALTVQQD